MLKKIIKSTAVACAMLIGLSATGCSDKSWAVKVNNATVPVGVYISFLYINREDVLSQASQSSSSSDTSSKILTGLTSQSSGSSSSSPDPWSLKIQDQTAYNWAINDALKSTKELAMAEEICAKKNIKLTTDEQTSLTSYATQEMDNYTGFKSNGVSLTSLQKVLGYNAYLIPKLIDAYYGKSGENPVSDTDLLNYYTSNFADIKQIYLTTIDDQGKALPDDQQKKIKAQADQIFNELSADKTKFASLQAQYDQDTAGTKANPDGFIFSKNNKEYIQSFTDAAFSIKTGDVKELQSDVGWHIMYRVSTNTSDTIYNDAMKTQVLQEMKSADLKKLLDDNLAKATVVKNDAAINHYDPKKLKDS